MTVVELPQSVPMKSFIKRERNELTDACSLGIHIYPDSRREENPCKKDHAFSLFPDMTKKMVEANQSWPT